MGYFLYLTATVFGLVKRHSRAVCIFVVGTMWLILAFNSDNADFAGYKYYYDFRIIEAAGAGLNTGFVATEQLGWFLGLDFYQYRALFGGIALVLVYRFVNKYSNAPGAVLSLYLLLPFLYDVTQFKFFLASSIALTAVSFLIDKKKHYVFFYILLMLMAFAIHPASALFSVFLIGLVTKRWAFLLSIVATILIVASVYSGLIQIILRAFMDSVKAEAYLTNISRFGFITYAVSTLFIIVLVICMQNELRRNSDDIPARGERPSDGFLSFFESGVFGFLPLTAFCIISLQNFYRPIRSALVMLYILYFLIAERSAGGLSRESKGLFTLGFILWFAFTFYIIMWDVSDIVVDAVLTNNLLW